MKLILLAAGVITITIVVYETGRYISKELRVKDLGTKKAMGILKKAKQIVVGGVTYTAKQFMKIMSAGAEKAKSWGEEFIDNVGDLFNSIAEKLSSGSKEKKKGKGQTKEKANNKNGKKQNGGNEDKNIIKADDKYLKKNKVDAHQVKKDYLGDKAPIAQYDFYIDKVTGRLFIFRKGGKPPGIPTDIFIKLK